MPELPDVVVYLDCLRPRVVGRVLDRVRVANPFLVRHLRIAGLLHWKPPGAKVPGKVGLAAFDFPDGTLIFTEAGTKRRASLHVVRGEEALARLRLPGLE